MSAAAPTTPADEPLGRTARLTMLLARLVTYGQELAEALSQHGIAALSSYPSRFGTGDVALILARIERGLKLALGLNLRIALLRQPDAAAKPRRPSARRTPRTPAPPSDEAPPRLDTAVPDPRLVPLPSPQELAFALRHRRIGAVIVEICRDLGITTKHPLWRDIRDAIIFEGGSLAAHVEDPHRRVMDSPLPGYPGVTTLTALTHLLTARPPPVTAATAATRPP